MSHSDAQTNGPRKPWRISIAAIAVVGVTASLLGIAVGALLFRPDQPSTDPDITDESEELGMTDDDDSVDGEPPPEADPPLDVSILIGPHVGPHHQMGAQVGVRVEVENNSSDHVYFDPDSDWELVAPDGSVHVPSITHMWPEGVAPGGSFEAIVQWDFPPPPDAAGDYSILFYPANTAWHFSSDFTQLQEEPAERELIY